MLDKNFQQNATTEVDEFPIDHDNQDLVGYMADLERITNSLIDHKAHDGLTSELVSIAMNIERLQKLKERSLGNELSALGEPAWKILIQLVIATKQNKNLSVADISRRASLPETTALRYLNILESKGCITQPPHHSDEEESQPRLTKLGQSIMRNTLSALNEV